MSRAAVRELNKVRLGPSHATNVEEDDDIAHNTGSEVESAPSDEEVGTDPVYEVDCVPWAMYRDSKFDRDDGFVGWHYWVMWRGYLKSGSETEEPREAFDAGENGLAPALLEFWKSVEGKKVRRGKDEPGGREGEVCHASDEYLRKKFKEARPRRNFEAYKRRVKKQREGLAITKADSDYYIRRKRKAAKPAAQAEQAGGTGQVPPPGPVAGPSARKESAEPLTRKRERKRSNSVEEMPPPTTTPKRTPGAQSQPPPPSPLASPRHPSPAPSFNSLFDEGSLPSNSQSQSTTGTPIATLKKKDSPEKPATKRPRVVASPSSPEAGKGTSQAEPSKEERAKAREKVLAGIGKIAKHGPHAPWDDEPVALDDEPMPPPPVPDTAPTFELDPTIFGGPSAPSPNLSPTHRRKQMPLFDFGDPPTPIKRETTSAPETNHPMRSDDPDEEEEVVDVPRTREPSFISVHDSEDEVAEVLGAETSEPQGAAEAAVDAHGGGDQDVVMVEDSPLPDFLALPGSSSPPAQPHPAPAPPRQASPPRPASSEPEPAQLPPGHVPLSIVLPASPRRNTQTAGAKSVIDRQGVKASPAHAAGTGAATPAAPGPPTSPPAPALAPPTTAPAAHPPTTAAKAPLSINTQTAEAGPSHSSASTSAETPVSATAPRKLSAATAAKAKLADRPKYKQPSKIRLIDTPIDPDRDPSVRHLPVAGRAPVSISPPAPVSLALPAVPAPPPAPAPPPQRRTWQAQPAPPRPPPPMNGERRPSYGTSPYGAGAVPGASPSWAGGVSPNAPHGVRPAGVSPHGGTSPYGPYPGRSPMHGGVSPMNGGMSPQRPPQPLPTVPEGGTYEAKRDPRRRARAARMAVAPPTSAPPPPTTAPLPPDGARRPLDDSHPLCTIRTTVESSKNELELTLRSGWSSDATYMLERAMSARHTYVFQVVDRRGLQMTLMEGGQIVEWAFVIPRGPPNKHWESWQRSLKSGNIHVCVDEIQPPNQPVTTHNILIIAPAKTSRIETEADLNGWKMDQLDIVAILLKVPMVPTTTVSDLPNPVRPFATKETSVPPPVPVDAPNTAVSYGFDDEAAAQVAARGSLCILPSSQRSSAFYMQVVQQAQTVKIKADPHNPKTVLVLNGTFSSATATDTFRNTFDRPTRYYSLGHDLMSLTTRWQMRPIWETGALVTFSPSFLLLNSERLGDIMKVIRTEPLWAAYIIPSTLIFLDEHLKKKAQDPVGAFGALTSALFLDDNERRLAGTMSTETSGLTVSCAPPPLPIRELCTRWIDWLGRVFKCTEYAPLVDLCLEYVVESRSRVPGPEATIAEVEEASINDLISMRTLPHTVPYRRCIYVGSLGPKLVDVAKKNGIDWIMPDSFDSVFAGAL